MREMTFVLAFAAAPVAAQEWDDLDVDGCGRLLEYMVQADDPDGLDGSALTAETIELEDGYCVFTGVSSTNTRDFSIHYDFGEVRMRGQGLERIADQQFPVALDMYLMSVVQIPVGNSDYNFGLTLDYAETIQNEFLSTDYALFYVADFAARTLEVRSFEVGLPYNRTVSGAFQVEGVDASDPAQFEASMPGGSVVSAQVAARGAGLYEFYLAEVFSNRFFIADDPTSFVEQIIAEAQFVVQAAPSELTDADSVAAASAFLTDLPHPTGALRIEVEATPGLGMARFARFALSGPPQSVEEVWPALEGVSIAVEYTPDGPE